MSSKLYTISTSDHARQIVETACKVLYLRSTTQIDELMAISSVSIQQRWDFIGPAIGDTPDPSAALFAAIDYALQWQSDDIGSFVRHQHFAPELTEDQAEILNVDSVTFERIDGETMRARVPFGHVPGSSHKTYFVELVWEDDEKWAYFNLNAMNGRFPDLDLPSGVQLSGSVEAAEDVYKHRNAGIEDNDDDDDDYWSQFPQPDKPKPKPKPNSTAVDSCNGSAEGNDGNDSDDYWGEYDRQANDSEPEQQGDVEQAAETQAQLTSMPPLPALGATPLLLDSVRSSLSGAAKAARAIGISESEFLQLAQATYISSGNSSSGL
ncbi:hypothetical protein GQ54DRAFT_195318 [Martensiomyces pterosporus]|nr:hypothetical protein GQ54DRAFT_195318 [Martensiomyces pterosporus]